MTHFASCIPVKLLVWLFVEKETWLEPPERENKMPGEDVGDGSTRFLSDWLLINESLVVF